MTPAETIRAAHALGITLGFADGCLVVGYQHDLPPDLLDALTRHRDEIAHHVPPGPQATRCREGQLQREGTGRSGVDGRSGQGPTPEGAAMNRKQPSARRAPRNPRACAHKAICGFNVADLNGDDFDELDEISGDQQLQRVWCQVCQHWVHKWLDRR